MSKQQDRDIYRRTDGKWANKRHDATRPSSLHETQKEAYEAGRQNLINQGVARLRFTERIIAK